MTNSAALNTEIAQNALRRLGWQITRPAPPKTGIVLHPGQRSVYEDDTRFRVVACGRRWGKTELGKRLVIDEIFRGGHVWWVSPTFGMADTVWRELKSLLHGRWIDKSEQQRRISISGGGIVEVKSGHDPDALRGVGLDGAILDEAAFMAGDVWQAGIRPALSDRQGWAMFLSTPNGLNWFHRLYQAGIDPLASDWASFHHPSVEGPKITMKEVEAARSEMSDRWFRQEYLAAFVEDAGQVFRNIDVVCTAQPGEPERGRKYVIGVDWGRSNDYTAVAVFDVERKQLVALDRFRQISWSQQRDRLRAMYNKWRTIEEEEDEYQTAILAEANSIGSVNIEALQQIGLPVRPFNTTAQSKGPLIEALALAMEREDVILLDDPVLRGELNAYTLERLPSGMYRYNAAPGAHDDTVIAVALGWMSIQHSVSAITVVVGRYA